MFLPTADRTPTSLFSPNSISRRVLQIAPFFLCCFATASAFGQTLSADNQPRKVSGTVINAVTKAPIPRALVFSSDNQIALLTDGEGNFDVTLPSDPNQANAITASTIRVGGCGSWLRARKPGFLDDCSNPGERGRLSDGDHTIALIPESLIYGRVTLPGSDALAGTSIQLYSREVIDGLPRWLQRANARTNSAGEFRFAELHVGEYRLLMHERADNDPVARDPNKSFGYPPVYYPGAPDLAGGPSIHVSAGQSIEADISATRQPYYRVTIPLADSDFGSGLAVTVQGQSGPGYSLGYNSGTKRIEGLLPTGNYMVEATSFGPNTAYGTVNLKVNGVPAEGPPMSLVAASSVTLDVKEQFTDTSWSGSTYWNDGKRSFTLRGPRSYFNPRLESIDDSQSMRGGSLRPPTGPNDTSMIFENLKPGRYWLRLTTARGYVASARIGDVDLLHQPLVVAAGSSSPIEIELRDDTSEIDGTVTGLPASANAESQPGNEPVWIYCVPLPDSAGQFQQLGASEDGRFNQAMMAPGEYRLLAFAHQQPKLPYRDPEAMKAYETKGPVVHLVGGQKLSVQVPLIADSNVPEE